MESGVCILSFIVTRCQLTGHATSVPGNFVICACLCTHCSFTMSISEDSQVISDKSENAKWTVEHLAAQQANRIESGVDYTVLEEDEDEFIRVSSTEFRAAFLNYITDCASRYRVASPRFMNITPRCSSAGSTSSSSTCTSSSRSVLACASSSCSTSYSSDGNEGLKPCARLEYNQDQELD